MFLRFIRFEALRARRSTLWQKNVITNIILGFFLFLMVIYIVALGLLIDVIIRELYPDQNPVVVFNGFLFYYFLADLFVRFYFQQVSSFRVESYLHLPVKRSIVVHFVSLRTVISIFNYLPLLIFIPFAIKVIPEIYSSQQALAWFFGLFLLVFANNFLATYLKRLLSSRPRIVIIFALLLLAMIFLDYFGLFSLSNLSSRFFILYLENSLMLLFSAGSLLLIYLVNFYFLKARLYPDEISIRKVQRVDRLGSIRYLKSLGTIGELISLDIKLMWRNKRPRTVIYLFPVFILYGLLFYPQEYYSDAVAFMIFIGVFMTGGMMLSYANYAFGWESNYFDGILTKTISLEYYIRTKVIISILVSSVCYVLTIPYLFFGWKVLFVNSMTFLYNIGVLVYVLLYMATYNKRRMDLSRSSAFNYQGIGASNWLAMLPAFLLPVLIYLPFRFAGYPNAGLLAIGTLGVAGLIFHKSLTRFIMKGFLKRRYEMAAGFREK